MNVTSVGSIPAAVPAPVPVQKPTHADKPADAGHNAAGHNTPQQKKVEVEAPKLPPLKPVSVQEFRVMLGALPPSALSPKGPLENGTLDTYV